MQRYSLWLVAPRQPNDFKGLLENSFYNNDNKDFNKISHPNKTQNTLDKCHRLNLQRQKDIQERKKEINNLQIQSNTKKDDE